jgi:hypothetical protein
MMTSGPNSPQPGGFGQPAGGGGGKPPQKNHQVDLEDQKAIILIKLAQRKRKRKSERNIKQKNVLMIENDIVRWTQ